MNQILTVNQIKEMHPGLFHAPAERGYDLMPEIAPILDQWRDEYGSDLTSFTIDVKIHMLMPHQWPSIPNWHFDMVPRDENGMQLMYARDASKVMFLWVSGSPLTEFMSVETNETRYAVPQTWEPFTQFDLHRGTMSTEHTWRLFARLCPRELLSVADSTKWYRRHSQVYLDAEQFKW